MNIRLTGEQEKQLFDALLDAFLTENELAQMVRFGGVVRNLATIAGSGKLGDVVFNLITWAGAHDKTGDLIIAARNANPTNAFLRTFAETVHLASQSPTTGELEAMVLKSVQFQDAEQWRVAMSQRELAVCRVETPSSYGTGFLVGSNLMMTNHHVLEHVINKQLAPNTVTFRFDYKMAADGVTLRPGITYGVESTTNWLVDNSPPGQLDYALVRLAGNPGQQPVGGQQNSPVRGWLLPTAHQFEVGEPLFIIQHPAAAPLCFTPGTVTAIMADLPYISYSANTLPGSSGSPCFSNDWELVAIHHTGDAKGNQGSRFAAILEQPVIKATLNL
jgi:V8-like Glu-specific endopeptidase